MAELCHWLCVYIPGFHGNITSEPRTPRGNVRERWAWAGTTSRCNWGAAVEVERNQGAAVEADAIGEKQLKRAQAVSSS